MIPAGLLVVDKPSQVTSHDVVARIRRRLGTRKVGHAGTLDPMATGVLLVGVERATRLLGYLAQSDKEYLATVRLGAASDTDDADGTIGPTAEPQALARVTPEAIRAAMAQMTGVIMQVPSAVSAIKVDGKRAYQRVRMGESVDLPARRVAIDAFEMLGTIREGPWLDLNVRVVCSSGTYVRALARDLGQSLGVGGHLTCLRRTRVGQWTADQALDLSAWQASADPARAIVPISQVAARAFPTLVVTDELARDVHHGRPIPWPDQHPESVLALMDQAGTLLALATEKDGRARYLAVLA